jgi:hypothetical protein
MALPMPLFAIRIYTYLYGVSPPASTQLVWWITCLVTCLIGMVLAGDIACVTVRFFNPKTCYARLVRAQCVLLGMIVLLGGCNILLIHSGTIDMGGIAVNGKIAAVLLFAAIIAIHVKQETILAFLLKHVFKPSNKVKCRQCEHMDCMLKKLAE